MEQSNRWPRRITYGLLTVGVVIAFQAHWALGLGAAVLVGIYWISEP